MRWLIVGWLFLNFIEARAQDNLTHCVKIIDTTTVSVSQVIIPSSIKVNGLSLNNYDLSIINSHEFIIQFNVDLVDSVSVCYTVLPQEFSKVYHTDTTRYYDSTALFVAAKESKAGFVDKRQELFNLGELNRSGQISRGFSTGNTQNLSVNSSLNLNLEGKLSEDLNIRASITDQDVPFQPEGNTQQLQDFDKVYIQLYNEDFSVAGGDVVLENGETRFLKYRKNVLGGTINYFTKNSKTSIGASSAKGQFASVAIQIQEGVYGPYKVPPPDRLGFVIIMANSEKIFLDGKLLIRGYDNDYIIDYNQAEIEFTSSVLLTQFSRIRIDYEYAVRSYERSIITASHTQKVGNVNLGISYYQEKDNKNKSLFRPLSDNDKQILSNAGDSLLQAIVPSEKITEYDPDRILYSKKDTLINGVSQSIFVHITQNKPTVYAVQFTNLGEGNGNYLIKDYLAQGRVYEWVGDGLGTFVPYILLTAPNSKKMVAITGEIALSKYATVSVETAFSSLDKNQFSDLHSDDNNGQAIILGGSIKKLPLNNSNYKFSSTLTTEYISTDFTRIDRFRRVEFDRDWGVTNRNTLGAQDVNMRASAGFEKDRLNYITYGINYRDKKNTVNGFQQQIGVSKSLGIFQVIADGFLMNGTMPTNNVQWKKFKGESYIRGKFQPGYRYILEQNKTVDSNSDSVLFSKNYYQDHQVFLRGMLNKTSKFELIYSRRKDQLPQGGELMQATEAETFTTNIQTQLGANHTLKVIMNYRKLNNQLPTTVNIESISGRIDWVGDIIPKSIRNELSYNIANARVPKREYVYIEVPTGQGTHAWRDDNGDGVKDIDEFYEAFNYDEKRFIKLYVPSNEFADAFENRFNYRFSLRFPSSWKRINGIKKIVSRFSNTTSWTTQYSTTEENISARLIPFLVDIDTSKLLSARKSFRTTFFINKNNPHFGASFGYLSRTRKVLYANGFEGREDKEYTGAIRWNIKRQFQFEINGVLAERTSNSDYLKGRNYSIDELKMGPTFAWQPKPTVRLTTTYNYGLSEQSIKTENADFSLLNELSSDLRLGTASKFVFNTVFKYTNIEFVGVEQSPIGYELLKGLRPGNNYSLVLSWQQRLLNGLQIQLFYEGRKPENVAIIHSMRAGISALF